MKANGKNRKRKWVRKILILYILFWIVTIVWGTRAVDKNFDTTFATGYSHMGQTYSEKVVRIDKCDLKNMESPGNQFPDGPWRCRNWAIAIAPFLIIDEVGWQTAPLGGFAGKRLVIWLPGKLFSFILQTYWVS